MSKKELKKLSLKSETLRQLTPGDLTQAVGGKGPYQPYAARRTTTCRGADN